MADPVFDLSAFRTAYPVFDSVPDATVQAAATAAQAAWSAALAANPALDPAFRMNPSTITSNQTIPTGYNAVSVGPLTIAENVEITIADGGNWTIA